MIVILDGVRTAMGGFQGSLSSCTAPDLGAAAIKAAVERAGLQPADIDEVIFGCVLPAGLKQGPARQAMRQAGLPDSTGATTINKICRQPMPLKRVLQKLWWLAAWNQCPMRRIYWKKPVQATAWGMEKPRIICSRKAWKMPKRAFLWVFLRRKWQIKKAIPANSRTLLPSIH